MCRRPKSWHSWNIRVPKQLRFSENFRKTTGGGSGTLMPKSYHKCVVDQKSYHKVSKVITNGNMLSLGLGEEFFPRGKIGKIGNFLANRESGIGGKIIPDLFPIFFVRVP